jgi:hypothetical protein
MVGDGITAIDDKNHRPHTAIYPPLLELCRVRKVEQRWETTSLSMYGTSLQKSRCLDEYMSALSTLCNDQRTG